MEALAALLGLPTLLTYLALTALFACSAVLITLVFFLPRPERHSGGPDYVCTRCGRTARASDRFECSAAPCPMDLV